MPRRRAAVVEPMPTEPEGQPEEVETEQVSEGEILEVSGVVTLTSEDAEKLEPAPEPHPLDTPTIRPPATPEAKGHPVATFGNYGGPLGL